MGVIKVIDIRLVPRWKFWRIKRIEAVLEDERGNRKTVSVWDTLPIIDSILKDYVAEKYCTGDQLWSLHQRDKRQKQEKKLPKTKELSKDEQMMNEIVQLKGWTFDCTLVLSKEAEKQ